jgi:uncharacterized membrane protein YkoI
MNFRFPLLQSVLAAALIAASACMAHADDDADRARASAQSGRILPLTRIQAIVQQRYPGELLEVELDDGDSPSYEIRVLQKSGRILEIEVDARSGRVLDVDEDD